MQQGEKSTQEETCPLCNTILAQKTYCDCQKLEIHKGECDNYSLSERVVNDEQKCYRVLLLWMILESLNTRG